MTWRSFLTRFRRRLRALASREALNREFDAEARQHIELEAEEIARRTGVAPEEARRQATLAFGGLTRYREEHGDARGVRWLEDSLQDLRHAGRGLRRNPLFALSAIAVLGLAIGSTTAVFSAVSAVLGNPVHDRLAVMFFRGFPSFSAVDYFAVEELAQSFDAVGARRRGQAALNAGGEPEEVSTAMVTAGFLQAVSVVPAHGRLIARADEAVGAPPVAVVSHDVAERRLGGAATAVGQNITLDGIAHSVIGVLPAGLRDLVGQNPDVWSAMPLAPPERRGPFGMLVIGRLKSGVTFESATADVRRVSERIFPLWTTTGYNDKASYFEAVPIRTAALAGARRLLFLFGAAAGLVLLIGVANVSSLMLVRATGRAREVSLRAALGASRLRLARLFATESLVLAACGAAVGIAIGVLGLRLLMAIGPVLPGLSAARIDLTAVAFAVAVALLSGVAVGAYPIFALLRRGGPAVTGSQSVGAGRDSRSLRGAFVVAQFALALPLLAIAGLLGSSFLKLQQVDVGFDARNLLTLRVSLPAGPYADPAAIAAFWTRALPRLREIPGVSEVGVVNTTVPNDFGNSNDNFDLVDRSASAGALEHSAAWPSASTEYFGALGVPLLEGRLFIPSDTGGDLPVAVVSRAWANRFYPGESPVGNRMTRGGCTDCPLTTIVGVVGDIRYTGLDGDLASLHSPVTEGWPRTLHVIARTTVEPRQLAGAVRAVLHGVDPTIPLHDLASMEERIYASIAQPRQWAILLGIFATAALALAAIGIFGMLSFQVTARHREIGVRMALGASGPDVVRMVVAAGLRHAAIGSLVGLGVALAAGRFVGAVLYGTSGWDPLTLGAVTLLLIATASVASWLPARRAAAIDPMEAIRSD